MRFASTLHLFFFLVLCTSTTFVSSQTYHPMPTEEASWDITRCWGFYPGGWHDEYTVVSDNTDTIINGRTYQNLYLVTHHLPGTEHDSIYTNYLGGMREANKQVFFISEYLTLDTFERMLYDFNEVSIGDTILTQILTNGLTQFIPHIVTSLDEVTVGGESHRRINLTDESGFFQESWTEGVGSNLGLVYASYWQLTDNSYDLNCFYENDALQYTNPNPGYEFCLSPLPEIECEETTSNDPDEEVTFKIFPNPVFDRLTIESSHRLSHIEVWTSLGQKILETREFNDVQLSFTPSGMYIIKCFVEEKPIIAAHKVIRV